MDEQFTVYPFFESLEGNAITELCGWRNVLYSLD